MMFLALADLYAILWHRACHLSGAGEHGRRGNLLIESPNLAVLGREILVAHRPEVDGPRWIQEVDDSLRPAGLTVFRARTGGETIRRVELGGLAAAVLITDRRWIDGLSLLSIIRSVDTELPCWLVTENPTRQTLQTALSLRVASVLAYPKAASELILGLRRFLQD